MNTKQSAALLSTSAVAAGIAQGAVVHSGSLNLLQVYPADPDRQGVNITGGPYSDFMFGFEGNAEKPYVDARNPMGVYPQSGLLSILGQADKGLPVTPLGTMIDASYASLYPQINPADPRGYMYLNDAGDTIVGDWSNTSITDAYVGIELNLSGNTHYGWLHFIDDPTADHLTLVDWAYESSPGVGIETAVIPEPSTAALTGLGIASLLLIRKRK